MGKALCISGGGALGAYGGGLAQNLAEKGHKWDLIIGTSTGSLLAPLVALGDFKRLREFYTNVTQNDIFKVNPFKSNGKLNLLRAAWRVMRGQKSLGDSSNLQNLIKTAFTIADYTKLREQNKVQVIVTVVNATKKRIEYKSLHDCGYLDFCDWIYASACVPILMSEFIKNGDIYWDGGVMEHTPLNHCLELGYNEVDIIIHREKSPILADWKPKNMFSSISHVIDAMQNEIAKSDITIADAVNSNDLDTLHYPTLSKLRTYFLPYKLTDNSLIFDKKTMNEWWDLGLQRKL